MKNPWNISKFVSISCHLKEAVTSPLFITRGPEHHVMGKQSWGSGQTRSHAFHADDGTEGMYAPHQIQHIRNSQYLSSVCEIIPSISCHILFILNVSKSFINSTGTWMLQYGLAKQNVTTGPIVAWRLWGSQPFLIGSEIMSGTIH